MAEPRHGAAPRGRRRRFHPLEKLEILRRFEKLPRGEKKAYLRGMGLHDSHLHRWRLQHAQEGFQGLSKRRGRRARPEAELRRLVAAQAREIQRLKAALGRYQFIEAFHRRLAKKRGARP